MSVNRSLDDLEQLLNEEPRSAQGTRRPQQTAAPVAAPVATGNAWAVGVALLAFGVPGWLVAGKYTVEGWIEWIRMLSTWFGTPLAIPRPVGWWLLIILPVALIYSRVEVKHRPINWRNRRLRLSSDPLFWVAWLLIVSTDILTTYTGVRSPAADAALLLQQVASSWWLSGTWATILTFAPEWMIIGAAYLIRR